MEITGKITKIFEPQTFSSGFRKRELIVTTQEQYPQPLSIEFLQERADLLNGLQVGEDVKVSINLRGREWTSPEGVTKYFNSIVGWRVEKLTAENAAPAQDLPAPESFNSQVSDLSKEDELDDLPF